VKYLLIDEDDQLHQRDADDWITIVGAVGPEGGNRIQLTRDLAAYVNDCSLVLTDRYRRNVIGGLLLLTFGAQRIPYAGPIVLCGWEPAATMRGEAEITGLNPVQVGMLHAVYTLVRDVHYGSPVPTGDLGISGVDFDAMAGEVDRLAELVAGGNVPGWTIL
jgi:hypothetical protein